MGLPKLIAHRGASQAALENTLPAFEIARSQGADGIEFDVQVSRDGLVVFHDDDLQRLAGRPDRVQTRTTRELCSLPLRSQPLRSVDSHAHRGQIMALETLLETTRTWSQTLHLELKCSYFTVATASTRLADTLRRLALSSEQLVVSSFHPEALLALSARLPSVQTALLVEDTTVGRALSYAAGASRAFGYLHPPAAMCTPRRLRAWKSRNVTVNTWTVNTPSVARRVDRVGVDGIITDNITAIRAALRTL